MLCLQNLLGLQHVDARFDSFITKCQTRDYLPERVHGHPQSGYHAVRPRVIGVSDVTINTKHRLSTLLYISLNIY